MSKKTPGTDEQNQTSERYDALTEYRKLLEIAKEFEIEIPLKADFTPDDVNKTLPLLRYRLADEAIQESKKDKTGKGYDTTGYSYQAHIDRMNWVFGPAHWQWSINNEQIEEGQTSGNYPKKKYMASGEIVVDIGYKVWDEENGAWSWISVHQVPPYPTDHESLERGSARKGMLTKGIKRATSTLGVGADAWLGIFDDDLITGAQEGDEMASPAAARGSAPAGIINRRDHEYLINTAKGKGLADTLGDWLFRQTDGRIDKATNELTNAEFEEAKKLLFSKIPRGKTIQDVEPQNGSQEPRRGATTNTDTTEGHSEPEAGASEAEEGEEGQPDPQNLDELVACTDDRLREIAKRYNFPIPTKITATNRSPLCKALANMMRLPA